MQLVSADEYLIGRISVARYIPPTRLCGGRASFSCVTSPQFAKYHVSRANNRATKGDNARGARYSVEKAVKLIPVFFSHREGKEASRGGIPQKARRCSCPKSRRVLIDDIAANTPHESLKKIP